jgi:phage-related protein
LTVAVVAFWPEIQRAGEAIVAFLSGAWASFEAAWDGMVAKVHAVKDAVVQFAADLVATFAALPGRMIEIGGQIIDGLWQGLQARWEGVKASVSGFASGIVDSFRSTLGIHSPSTVMREIGVNIMQGLSDGMESMRPAVDDVSKGMASGIEGAFSSIGNSISQAIQGTKSWRDVALDAIRSVAQSVLSNLNFGGGAGGGIFGSLLKGLFGGLLGFASGGTILPGGAGGIDSQVVAFRKSPNERVDITKPGQMNTSGGAQELSISVNVSGARGNQEIMQMVSEGVRQGLDQYDRSLPDRIEQFNRNPRSRRA